MERVEFVPEVGSEVTIAQVEYTSTPSLQMEVTDEEFATLGELPAELHDLWRFQLTGWWLKGRLPNGFLFQPSSGCAAWLRPVAEAAMGCVTRFFANRVSHSKPERREEASEQSYQAIRERINAWLAKVDDLEVEVVRRGLAEIRRILDEAAPPQP